MMQAKTRFPWLLLLLWFPMTSAFAQPDLTVGSATGQPGATVSTAVSFTNNNTVVWMSFYITFNPALVTPGAVMPSAALALHHTVATNISPPGTLRVAITSPTTDPLPTVSSGILLTIPWTITAGSAPTTTALTLAEVRFANNEESEVTPNALTSGQITIQGAVASANIPTLSEWALLLLSVLLGGMVWKTQARRTHFQA